MFFSKYGDCIPTGQFYQISRKLNSTRSVMNSKVSGTIVLKQNQMVIQIKAVKDLSVAR